MSSLPFPNSLSNYAKPRSRWRILIIIAVTSTALLFYFTSEEKLPFRDRLPPLFGPQLPADDDVEWRPDMAFDVTNGKPVAGKPFAPAAGDDLMHPGQRLPKRPPKSGQTPDDDDDGEIPADMPIREDPALMPIYKYGWNVFPPSDSDPWPDRPEIAQKFFDSHKKPTDPPVPQWPSAQDFANARNNSLEGWVTKDNMVPYETLYTVANSKGDVKRLSVDGMGKPVDLPKVQTQDHQETSDDAAERRRRKDWVERAIRHGWEGYKAYAWGADEVMPLTNGTKTSFNGWGATLVDTLDLLLMLGWDHEYALARTHVRAIDFTFAFSSSYSHYIQSETVPTFETCIRYLGGFIAAYDLSGDQLMLDRAKELADWLIGGFGTQYGLPVGRYGFGEDLEGMPSGGLVLAEAGTMSLEFTRLAQVTGEQKYFDIVQRVTDHFDTAYADSERPAGLFPLHVSDEPSSSLAGTYSFGGQGDSYYEYLIKEYYLLGGAQSQYSRMYNVAIDSMHKLLVSQVTTVPGQTLLTIGEESWSTYAPTCNHLTCFAGAMLGLGSKLLGRAQDLDVAEKFTETCVWAYNVTSSGIGPEDLTFWKDKERRRYTKRKDKNGKVFAVPRGAYVSGIKRMNTQYRGRPETIESVFYMWRITGDRKWQDKGWSMFHSFVEASAVESGFAAVANVAAATIRNIDLCESFVYAETLKYYWLLFSESSVMSLDDFVFSTEAHPFRLPHNQRSGSPFVENAEVETRYANPHGSKQIGLGTYIQQHARVNQTRQAIEREELEKERSRHRPAKVRPAAGEQDEPKAFIPVGMGGRGGQAQ